MGRPQVLRDAFGVPHLRASSLLDLAAAQGEVTARDRAWQLEHARRRATGTTAAVLGPGGLPWDRLARRTDVAGTAQRAFARLDDETAAFVTAYVEGVNAALHADAPELRALDLEPGRWEPWTPLAVFLAGHLLFASMPGKLWAHRAREVLGPAAELLSHEGPHSSGSNAWAVGGDRTASGLPLVGGDPHRVIEAPGVYQQVRLACDDPADRFDVVGFTFPGVPGVQHFAHAGEVAWAITNAMADYQDLHDERLRRTPDGGLEALGPDGWRPATSRTETVEVAGGEAEQVPVVRTERGPLVEGGIADGADEGHGLSLRAPSLELDDLGFGAFLPLLRARTVDDVDRALDAWVEPVNNVVIADVHGAVRYRVAGRVPLRADANRRGRVRADDPEAAWRGWAELPRHDVPPDGHVVTANERRGPESDVVGAVFAPPHRARRLHQLLEGRTGLTAADFEAMHGDTLALGARALQDLARAAEPGPAGAAVRAAVLAWDCRADATSPGAAAYAAWRSALVRRLADAPALAPLREPAHDAVFGPWLDLVGRLGPALETLWLGRDRTASELGIDLVAEAAAALDDAASHPGTWGATHVLTPAHAADVSPVLAERATPPVPEVPLSGDGDCVRCTGSVPGLTDACWRGSVARYVWDLGDRTAGGWSLPLGAHGDPEHPHHRDQLPLWAEARLAPIVTDWDQLTEEP